MRSANPSLESFAPMWLDKMEKKAIILCKSVHHQNTKQLADAMAQVLDAEVIDPDKAVFPTTGDYSVLGIGSGIYYARFHRTVREWVRKLPKDAGNGHRIFLFSTSGLPFLTALYHAPLRRKLQAKGFQVTAEFSCRGHDSFAFLRWIGGLNRTHPNAIDLERAREFARSQSLD